LKKKIPIVFNNYRLMNMSNNNLISSRLWQQREGEIAMDMNHDKKSPTLKKAKNQFSQNSVGFENVPKTRPSEAVNETIEVKPQFLLQKAKPFDETTLSQIDRVLTFDKQSLSNETNTNGVFNITINNYFSSPCSPPLTPGFGVPTPKTPIESEGHWYTNQIPKTPPTPGFHVPTYETPRHFPTAKSGHRPKIYNEETREREIAKQKGKQVVKRHPIPDRVPSNNEDPFTTYFPQFFTLGSSSGSSSSLATERRPASKRTRNEEYETERHNKRRRIDNDSSTIVRTDDNPRYTATIVNSNGRQNTQYSSSRNNAQLSSLPPHNPINRTTIPLRHNVGLESNKPTIQRKTSVPIKMGGIIRTKQIKTKSGKNVIAGTFKDSRLKEANKNNLLSSFCQRCKTPIHSEQDKFGNLNIRCSRYQYSGQVGGIFRYIDVLANFLDNHP
jgi:hypothetical protein